MQLIRRPLAGAAIIVLLANSAMAAAATTVSQPINPLTAVSVYGTQASAQAVCTQAASSAAAAGAAVAAQGQGNCVLPATDAPPLIGQSAAPPPPLPGPGFGAHWLLMGLAAIVLVAGISTLFGDDDDGAPTPISPS